MACQAQETKDRQKEKTPKVPDRQATITLDGETPVVALKLTLSGNNEVAVEVNHAQYGTPTSGIVQNRDIKVESVNANGRSLYALTINDPRVVHEDEADGEDHQHAVMEEGTVILFLPYSDEFHSVRITGQTPNLEGLKAEREVSSQVKEAFRKLIGQ